MSRLLAVSHLRVGVYGHLDIPRTSYHDGVRFDDGSLGCPREWRRRGDPPAHVRSLFGASA